MNERGDEYAVIIENHAPDKRYAQQHVREALVALAAWKAAKALEKIANCMEPTDG